MKIDIYKSALHGDKYLSVPSGTNVNQLTLPGDIDKDLLVLSPFKSPLEIGPQFSHIGLDSDNVRNQIRERGFAIHGATVKVELKINHQNR